MQVGRFDQVRFIHEVQCHEDHLQEELSSSESLSDKTDTESEAEFVTATGSASNNQASSEESDLERKHVERARTW